MKKSKYLICLLLLFVVGCEDTPDTRQIAKPEDFYVSKIVIDNHEYNVFKMKVNIHLWETIDIEHSKECKECFQ